LLAEGECQPQRCDAIVEVCGVQITDPHRAQPDGADRLLDPRQVGPARTAGAQAGRHPSPGEVVTGAGAVLLGHSVEGSIDPRLWQPLPQGHLVKRGRPPMEFVASSSSVRAVPGTASAVAPDCATTSSTAPIASVARTASQRWLAGCGP
jgi:hypothetical protein